MKVVVMEVGGARRGIVVKQGIPVRAPPAVPTLETVPKCAGIENKTTKMMQVEKEGKGMKDDKGMMEEGKGETSVKGKSKEVRQQEKDKGEGESGGSKENQGQCEETYKAGEHSLARKASVRGGFYFFTENPFLMNEAALQESQNAWKRKKRKQESLEGNPKGKVTKQQDEEQKSNKEKEEKEKREWEKQILREKGGKMAKQMKEGPEYMGGGNWGQQKKEEEEWKCMTLEEEDDDF